MATLPKVVGGSGSQYSVRHIIAVDMEGELIPSTTRSFDVCERRSGDEDTLTGLLAIRPRFGSYMHPGSIDACCVSAARLTKQSTGDDCRAELAIGARRARDKLANILAVCTCADLL